MSNIENKDGFTLVEVALVLAVAGLIFAATMAVLPALWRSERDGARREAMMTFITKLKNFQTNNNRGALPTGTDVTVAGSSITFGPTTGTTWEDFYKGYFDNNFTDPDGTRFNLVVKACGSSASKKCSYTGVDVSKLNHNIYVFVGAICDGENAMGSANSRKVAAVYKLEGGGIFCYNS